MLAESMRKRIGWLVFQVLSVATGAFGQSDPRAKLEATFARTVRPFLATHCVTCHGSKQPAAQMDLSGFTSMAALTRISHRHAESAGTGGTGRGIFAGRGSSQEKRASNCPAGRPCQGAEMPWRGRNCEKGPFANEAPPFVTRPTISISVLRAAACFVSNAVVRRPAKTDSVAESSRPIAPTLAAPKSAPAPRS